jgi:hypothetical protein
MRGAKKVQKEIENASFFPKTIWKETKLRRQQKQQQGMCEQHCSLAIYI